MNKEQARDWKKNDPDADANRQFWNWRPVVPMAVQMLTCCFVKYCFFLCLSWSQAKSLIFPKPLRVMLLSFGHLRSFRSNAGEVVPSRKQRDGNAGQHNAPDPWDTGIPHLWILTCQEPGSVKYPMAALASQFASCETHRRTRLHRQTLVYMYVSPCTEALPRFFI
jgi:hypothetical protein